MLLIIIGHKNTLGSSCNGRKIFFLTKINVNQMAFIYHWSQKYTGVQLLWKENFLFDKSNSFIIIDHKKIHWDLVIRTNKDTEKRLSWFTIRTDSLLLTFKLRISKATSISVVLIAISVPVPLPRPPYMIHHRNLLTIRTFKVRISEYR